MIMMMTASALAGVPETDPTFRRRPTRNLQSRHVLDFRAWRFVISTNLNANFALFIRVKQLLGFFLHFVPAFAIGG
jgi:hypothetical protein